MTDPKQKAQELCDKFFGAIYKSMTPESVGRTHAAKQCAIICVEEIRKTDAIAYEHDDNYWQQVLTELKNM